MAVQKLYLVLVFVVSFVCNFYHFGISLKSYFMREALCNDSNGRLVTSGRCFNLISSWSRQKAVAGPWDACTDEQMLQLLNTIPPNTR